MPSTARFSSRGCLRQRERSRLLNEAVYYIEQKALADLREQLKEGAISRAERDLGLVKF